MSDEPTAGDGAAFFDLDRTLIGINSAFEYARYERARGRISLWDFLQASLWMGLYHLSIVDIERAFARALRTYRGAHADELMDLTRQFFEEEVVHTFQPGAARALQTHRDQDHKLVLLTASSPYMSKLAAQTWDLDDWLSNRFPTDDKGCLRGTFEQPLCYGDGKVHRARQWADRHGVALENSYFYTDSYSDLPMLEVVGHPRVVNPDPRLHRAAQRRQWPIEDWATDTPPAKG